MKKYDYNLAIPLIYITGIVFFTQLWFESSEVILRKEGYEWVIYACAAAFAFSIVYSLVLVILNSINKHGGTDNGTSKRKVG